MKYRNLFSLISLCVLVFALAQALSGYSSRAAKPAAVTATFTVNSADDHDDTACTAGDCTLREAINAANASPGTDTIAFAIGSGAQTINIKSPLSGIHGN